MQGCIVTQGAVVVREVRVLKWCGVGVGAADECGCGSWSWAATTYRGLAFALHSDG